MKKIISMFLSLVLCVSMLAALPQAAAHAEEPEPIPITAPVEPIDPTDPTDPEPPIDPMEMGDPEGQGDCF